MKGTTLLALFAALFCALAVTSTVNATSKNEIEALLDLYVATGGPRWITNTNWGVGDPCSDYWYGVTCIKSPYSPYSPSYSNISALALQANNLNGRIPSSISNLKLLQKLDLHSNKIHGFIPSDIGDMQDLATITLNNNTISGTIPPSMGSLKSLSYLDLSFNKLSGKIPATLGQIYYLNTLFLQNNNLNGTLPIFLQSQPSSSRNVNVSNNEFSCPLPAWCSAPPTGNGRCAPCVVPSTTLYCCTYSSNGCRSVTSHSCSSSECPEVTGLSTCGIFPVSSCSYCAAPTILLDLERDPSPPIALP